ncbi:AGE family epimerase/isomerase [Emcibacteraceae bacterium]|nr:AGE family epimerase/isomerase [Emcibacteraceae bacterium]MDC1429717.1 AGE family epimerase/isomerase [Emcibacteraceae bacterium]
MNPQFHNKTFLEKHIKDTMSFYHPHCIDPNGGFFQLFKDDGTIFDHSTRHLVSSCRFVFTYSMYAQYFNDDAYKNIAQHGIDFLRNVHRNESTEGYAWVIKNREVADPTNYCYGLAFVLLSYATALKAGIVTAKAFIYETFDVMEEQFWEKDYGLYADECDGDWELLSPYRGQNANMHSCEAMIAAFEATGDRMFLDKAYLIAENICVRQAGQCDGLIWEHYDENWQVDWDYNKSDPKNLFRPWGFQPGHLTEWSKLLMILNGYSDQKWLVDRATELFDAALEKAWDQENKGISYGFAPDGSICDGDKYFWVQAESFSAAAFLAQETKNPKYWDHYEKIWQFSWDHMIDHDYGAWYCKLDANNQRYSDIKSPTGKTDYHTMGACYAVLSAI